MAGIPLHLSRSKYATTAVLNPASRARSILDRDITLAFIRAYPTPAQAGRISTARMAAFTDRTATAAAECPRPSWTACSRDLYGFRTSLTVRHRDMVDRQPVPATVSRCRTKSPSESDSDIAARVTVEIRLRAVTEVNDGAPVGEVAERYGVSRQTVTCVAQTLRGRRSGRVGRSVPPPTCQPRPDRP